MCVCVCVGGGGAYANIFGGWKLEPQTVIREPAAVGGLIMVTEICNFLSVVEWNSKTQFLRC